MATVTEEAASELRYAMEAIPGLPQRLDHNDQYLINEAKTINIIDDSSRLAAGIIFNDVYRRKKEYEGRLAGFHERSKTVKRAMDAIYGAFKNLLVTPFQEAQDRLSRDIGHWDQVLEDARLVEERRLQEIANKKARDQQLAEAVTLEKRGEGERAADVMSSQPVVAEIKLEKLTPRIAGQANRTYYHAEVTDLSALVKAWLDGNVEKKAIIANQSFLDDFAQATKGDIEYPGVRVLTETKTKPTGRA